MYHRRRTIVLTLLLCVVATTGYWLTLEQKSEVIAVFLTGKVDNLKLMPTKESATFLTSIYIPNSVEKHSLSTGVRLNPSGIQIVNNEQDGNDTSVIALSSECSGNDEQLVISVINSSLEDLASRHKVRYERLIRSINSLLETKLLELSSSKLLASSPEHTAVDQAAQQHLEAITLNLQTKLATSYPSEILKHATAIPQRQKSYLLFGIYGIVFGLFLGCALAFFLELLSKAKVRVAENK
jgi:hypothetical protein